MGEGRYAAYPKPEIVAGVRVGRPTSRAPMVVTKLRQGGGRTMSASLAGAQKRGGHGLDPQESAKRNRIQTVPSRNGVGLTRAWNHHEFLIGRARVRRLNCSRLGRHPREA